MPERWDNAGVNVLGMGPLELLVIAALALIVFGPDKLPEVGRQVGRVVGEVRRITSDATAELQRGLSVDAPSGSRPRPPSPLSRDSSSEPSKGGSDGPLPPY